MKNNVAVLLEQTGPKNTGWVFRRPVFAARSPPSTARSETLILPDLIVRCLVTAVLFSKDG